MPQQDSTAGPSMVSRKRSRAVQVMASEDSSSNDASTDNGDEDNCFQPSIGSSRSEGDEQGDEESDEGGVSIGRQSPSAVGAAIHSGQNTSTRVIRSVRACTSQSKATGNITPAQAPPPTRAFKFLQLESYSCACSPIPNPSRAPTNASAATTPQCKVLLYFGMLFLDAMQAIFCPTHHCFVPMACWADHVRRTHKDWISSTKVDECRRMAEHVALSCGLDLEQDTKDLHLPNEIDQPFESYRTLTDMPIYLSY